MKNLKACDLNAIYGLHLDHKCAGRRNLSNMYNFSKGAAHISLDKIGGGFMISIGSDCTIISILVNALH